MNCPLCESTQTQAFGRQVVVMDHHPAQYWQCDHCRMVFAGDAGWLDESYRSPITDTDLGYCSRNLSLVRQVHAILAGVLGLRSARGLDFGGGYGLFVRLMRDRGWDFRLHEPHTPNLFAGPFVHSPETPGRYDVITALEVIEHLPRPLQSLRDWLRMGRSVVFSTQLLPAGVRSPEDWWYFGLRHGQHVSLFSPETLRWLASELGCVVVSAADCHLIVPTAQAPHFLGLRMRLFLSGPGCVAAWLLFRRPSLLPCDYRQVTGRGLTQTGRASHLAQCARESE